MSDLRTRNAVSSYDLENGPSDTRTRNTRLTPDSEPSRRSASFSDSVDSNIFLSGRKKTKSKPPKDHKNLSLTVETAWNDIITDDDTVRCVDDVLPTAEKSVPDDQSKAKQADGRRYTPSAMANVLNDMFCFANLGHQLYLHSEDAGCWLLVPQSEAHRKLREITPAELHDSITKYTLAEIYEWLCVRTPTVQNAEHRYLLNFVDQAIDWRTSYIEHDRDRLHLRYALQVQYDTLESHRTGAFEKFLADVFGDDDLTRREFQKFLGLALSDIRSLKLCFFLYGPSNTGKSVVLNLLKKIVGDAWCSSVSFAQMSNEFAITQLLGKRLNLSGEMSGVTNNRLDIFKSLTGNDSLTAAYKGKDHFQFVNEALLVFACNNFPRIRAAEEFDSVLSRIIFFPFMNVKPRDKWIEDLETVLFDDIGSIIQYAIDGLQALEEDHFQFHESEAMKNLKHKFIGENNSFLLFSDVHLEKAVGESILSRDIEERYHEFCLQQGLEPLDINTWPSILERNFGCSRYTRTIPSDNGPSRRARGYKGIRFTDTSEYIIERR